ncbi:MAG: rod-binding protein [SAR324 cluster bacterium]|nr:rod-binding protein [SAR324 cluster bacterium]MCZ6728075.1 rod-binding protein [SAR324 cluster bacterium]
MRLDLDVSLPRLEPASEISGEKLRAGQDKARLRKAAQEFEALLVEQMLKEMRKSVPESNLFGKEKGREIFKEMLDGEFVRLMTGRGGIGLADFIVRNLENQYQGK